MLNARQLHLLVEPKPLRGGLCWFPEGRLKYPGSVLEALARSVGRRYAAFDVTDRSRFKVHIAHPMPPKALTAHRR